MRGSIIKRGSTYSVVLDLGRGPDGRRVRKWHSGYRTRKEAERARTEILSRLDHGTYGARSPKDQVRGARGGSRTRTSLAGQRGLSRRTTVLARVAAYWIMALSRAYASGWSIAC